LDRTGHVVHIIHRIEDVTDLVHLKRAGREHSRMTRRLGTRIQLMEAEVGERARQLQDATEQLRATNQALARWQSAIGERQPAEILGLLTSSIAHDFNNLMTIIAGSLSIVQDSIGGRGEGQRLRRMVERALERGARLTNQLLTVGHSHISRPDMLDFNELLRDFRVLAEPIVDVTAEAHVDPAAQPPSASKAAAFSLSEIQRPVMIERATGAPRGSERILVVEDDPDVLDAVIGTVARLGYQTGAARDSLEALAVLGKPEAFDLLFTDIVMPQGMSGIELARRARELQPNLRVLLTSGYGFHAMAADADDGFPMLQKPYQREALADTLRHVLGP
jgi:CheY-like chemotaxis protein